MVTRHSTDAEELEAIKKAPTAYPSQWRTLPMLVASRQLDCVYCGTVILAYSKYTDGRG